MPELEPELQTDPDDDRGEQYGRTAALESDGDLYVTAAGKLGQSYDQLAVENALKVALATPKGFDDIRPEYGLDIFQAFGTTDAELRLAIHDAIGPEAAGVEAVESIEDVEIDRDPGQRNGVDLNITVRLVDSGVAEFDFGLRRDAYRGLS